MQHLGMNPTPSSLSLRIPQHTPSHQTSGHASSPFSAMKPISAATQNLTPPLNNIQPIGNSAAPTGSYVGYTIIQPQGALAPSSAHTASQMYGFCPVSQPMANMMGSIASNNHSSNHAGMSGRRH